jgi:glycosyltransferase involved in cell wall biosynthesis
MTYAFFIPTYSYGGLEIQTIKRAIDAKNRNNTVLVICSKNSRVEKFAQENDLTIENIKLGWDYIDIFSTFRLLKIFKKYQVDICVVGSAKLLIYAILAKSFSTRNISVIFYQQMQSDIKKRDLFHDFIYKRLDGAIVLTELMKDQLSKNTVLTEEKIAVIPYGVEYEKYLKINHDKKLCRNKFNLPENDFIIGNVARIDRHKDQLTAIRAYFKANIPNSSLVLAGSNENSDYYNTLLQEIKDHPLHVKIRFIPFTNDIPELMNCFDIFAMTSTSETFGLVFIEAMAASLPAIGVNSGGVPEIITNGINGFLIEQYEYQKLAEYLKLLYDDKELYHKLSDNALQTVIDNYNYNIQTDKFFNFIDYGR